MSPASIGLVGLTDSVVAEGDRCAGAPKALLNRSRLVPAVIGAAMPGWCRAAVPELPALMAAADRRERELERAVLDHVEAVLLAGRVGETFEAVVTDADERGATIQLAEPAVRARLTGTAPLGERVAVRLTEADPAARRVRFVPA